MKFPYGLSDFAAIRQEGYFYQDRTDLIPQLEQAGRQLLFLRPRRFGKSLLLSMLENYYDVRRADQFESLFGTLAIGQNPTPLHNQYCILHWDFSLVKCRGEIADIEMALHRCLNLAIENCADRYQLTVATVKDDAIISFGQLLKAVYSTGQKLYLFIDEYDNFANEVLVARQDHYEALLYGDGLFRTLFKAVKAAASGQGLERVFITGVSPVAMSDMTSGYNVAEDIYLEPEFNALCGFTEAEVAGLLKVLMPTEEAGLSQALLMLKTFYNGYRFSPLAAARVYNPTLTLYFLKRYHKYGTYPQSMLDDNLSMDRNRLNYIAERLQGEPVLLDALDNQTGVVIPALSSRFGVEDLHRIRDSHTLMASLLYYLGILTLDGEAGFGECRLGIPNLVVRSLYVERLQDWLALESADLQTRRAVARQFCLSGEMEPVCQFIETRLLKTLSIRDYRWTNELAIKILFMAVLFNDHIYMMVSETEVNHGYADLSFIVRPDMRRFKPLDLVLEFKYVSLNEVKLSSEEIRQKSREELMRLPLVVSKLAEAETQVMRYGDSLIERFKLPSITRFAVVALGLERLVFRQVPFFSLQRRNQ
jgi:hypothetical protein